MHQKTINSDLNKCLSANRICKYLLLLYFVIASYGLFALEFSDFSTIGFEGKGQLEFNDPEDLIITKEGRVIVADNRNNRLQIIGSDGNFLGFVPNISDTDSSKFTSSTAEVRKQNLMALLRIFRKPIGLAMDSNNKLYVTLMEVDKIAIIDPRNGFLLGTICSSGKKQGQLYGPMDIDISFDDHIAVAEWRNKRVQILNNAGECLKELIYHKKNQSGSFTSLAPRGVHWTNEGNLIVSYPLYNQVICWNPKEGKVVWRYGGKKGSDRGMLHNPSFITSTYENNLLISDTLNNRIVEITKNGKFVEHHGRKGSRAGALLDPRGIALTKDETLIISDQGNNRINFFKPGQTTVMLRKARQLSLKDEWKEALPLIEQVMNLQPNNQTAIELMVNALYFFGNEAFSTGMYNKADEFYRKILRYRPNDPNIPEKLDSIFWAINQGFIASAVVSIIVIILALTLIWTIKVLIYRFMAKPQE